MNVNFNYGNWRNAGWNNYGNWRGRSNRMLMRQLKLPYTWENAQTMKKVDRITRSISQANLQKFYRNVNTDEVPKRELDRIKRELGKALGRTANNRDVYFIFASAWGTNYFGGYTPNDNIEKDTNFRSPGWNNVNRDDVVGRLATKFGRDTSKAELTRFKKAFFRKIARDTPRDLETLKTILRSTPILYAARFGNINNLRGWSVPIKAIRNAANYVYGQTGLRNNNNSNNNNNNSNNNSNSNTSASYMANTKRCL